MSRCYPYSRITSSRRSSVRNGTGNGNEGSDVPFIQSFKLQSKNEKPKTEQVKEKGWDKERKKVWKQKDEKPTDFIDGKVKKLKNDECYRGKKFKDSFSNSCLTERSEEGKAESLDNNSGLTEEHDEPTSVYSSGGTQSSKRQRDSTSSTGITVHRNILRIRLPSRTQREHDALPSKEQSYPAARKVADSRDQRETVRLSVKEEQYCSTNYINREVPSPILVSAKESSVPSGSKAAVAATSYESQMQRTELIYQSLMDNVASTPLLLQFEMDVNDDDQEWLFGTKQQRQACKKLKASDDISCRRSSSMWLQAQFLPEADIYSLPYTIPF